MQCAPPLIVATGVDESTLKREGVCAASLPTTMGIVAGMLVQNSLKFMLEFGEIAHYVGYAALTDFYPTMRLGANPECDNAACRACQKRFKASGIETLLPWCPPAKKEVAAVQHEDNDWGISCDDVGAGDESGAEADKAMAGQLTEGVSLQYMRSAEEPEEKEPEAKVQTGGQSVAEMMAALKASQKT